MSYGNEIHPDSRCVFARLIGFNSNHFSWIMPPSFQTPSSSSHACLSFDPIFLYSFMYHGKSNNFHSFQTFIHSLILHTSRKSSPSFGDLRVALAKVDLEWVAVRRYLATGRKEGRKEERSRGRRRRRGGGGGGEATVGHKRVGERRRVDPWRMGSTVVGGPRWREHFLKQMISAPGGPKTNAPR